jgi:hypothetical protein
MSVDEGFAPKSLNKSHDSLWQNFAVFAYFASKSGINTIKGNYPKFIIQNLLILTPHI